MCKLQPPNINNMKGQDSVSPLKPTSLIEIASNEKYLGESQKVEFKWAIINMIKEFRVYNEDQKIPEWSLRIHKYRDKWKKKKICNLKTELSNKIEILKKVQAEDQMKLETSII